MRGLATFQVWVDGCLRRCNLEQARGDKGRFTQNSEGEYIGVLEDSRRGRIRQDNEAKLYFIPEVEQLT